MWLRLFLWVLVASAIAADTTGKKQTPPAEKYNVEGPITFRNLTLFLIRSPLGAKHDALLSLEEALLKKYVIVYETEEVRRLEIENFSDFEIFIQAGEIVKGGKQDRVLRADLILPPRSGKVGMPSFCVELGRWQGREHEESDKFEMSNQVLAHQDIKVAAVVTESQDLLWKEVAEVKGKFAPYIRGGRAGEVAHETSLQLAQDDPDLQGSASVYIDSIQPHVDNAADAVGIVTVINGEIRSADMYRSTTLFSKLKHKLLNACALEALADRSSKTGETSVNAEDVRKWLDAVESGESRVQHSEKGLHIVRKKLDNQVGIESRVDSQSTEWIHKTIISTQR